MTMRYNLLGRTGLSVSAIGFGGIPIQRTSATETSTLLRALHAKGVNFIDSARAYTVSEAYIGEALESTGLRAAFVIATKSMARSYDEMARDIDISLRNLRTNYIDLYQMHNIAKPEDFALAFSEQGAMAALRDAVKAGKVRHIGASAHSVTSFATLLEHPEIETIMFPYNIVENQGEALMERCAQNGVGFIAMKPLAGGNIENGTLALRYILQNPHCNVAIPGMESIDELEKNCAALAMEGPLTESELAEIKALRARLSGNFCRRCGYCAPCTQGINIPSLFILHGYLTRYNLVDWAKTRYAATEIKPTACIRCGKCEARCPYDLPIMEKMRQVSADFAAVQL